MTGERERKKERESDRSSYVRKEQASRQYTLIIPHWAMQLSTKAYFFFSFLKCRKNIRATSRSRKLTIINRDTGLKKIH